MTSYSSTLVKRFISKKAPLILIVDDNEDNLLYISLILDTLNIKYFVAYDGESALDLAKDKLPDLVLLDIVMPKINGMELTALMKSSLLTGGIPIIATTGLTSPKHITAINAAGFDDYIIKPFLIEDLEAKLKYFLKIKSVSSN